MVSLTFYGGVNEIGGNKILIEDRGTRIFFDFGESFNMGSGLFTGYLSPRSVNGLGDYFEFELLPRLKGLYSKKQLENTALPPVDPEYDAVFLSHAHFDHVSHIQFLDESIPLFLGAGTKLFLKAMENTSSFCNYGVHQYRTFRTGDKIKVDNVVVRPVHVDHSIPAAYGFIIETSEGTVIYTGDVRSHGPKEGMTKEFAELARASRPSAMVCEGTRMVDEEKRKNYSEHQVEAKSGKIVSATNQIVFVTRYSRDMDRFNTFYHVAKKNDRRLVVSPKTAHLLSRLVEDEHLDLPDPLKDDDILVYYKRKRSGRFLEKDYRLWERAFMDKMVTHKFVHDNQSGLVMDLDFYQFTELVDIQPDPGGKFIHSMSEPFSEEDIEDQVMHNWLNHFHLGFHQLHASGHMNREELTELMTYINPGRVFPIHTENPQLFPRAQTEHVEYGRKFRLQ